MLELARTPVEAKRVADLAKAAETTARLQQLGEEAVSHARAICVDALLLMGKMLKTAEKNTGVRLNGKDDLGGSRLEPPKSDVPTLADQGISGKQSMHAQALAAVRESDPALFERVRAEIANLQSA